LPNHITVQIEPPRVFIDSGGFVALYDPNDAYHAKAVIHRTNYLDFPVQLFTSNLVVSETISRLLQRKPPIPAAVEAAIADFQKKGWITILSVHGEQLDRSLEKLITVPRPRQSLVDASNLVLLQDERITRIFTFDSFYDTVTISRGYELISPQREPR